MLIAPNVVTPLEYGIGLSQVNDAIMTNKGFELLAGTAYRVNKNLSFKLNGTLTFVRNKVLQIYETSTIRTEEGPGDHLVPNLVIRK